MPVSYFLARNKSIRNLLGFLIFLLVKLVRLKNYFLKVEGMNIAVITLHKLGDSVFTIPCIREIQKLSGKETYILCFQETKPIFRLFFKEEFIITFKHSEFYFNDRIAKSFVRKRLNKIRPCKIYDLTGSIRSASILFPSAVKEIIGINDNYFKSIYSMFVPKRTNPHLIDIYIDVINYIIPDNREKLKEFPSEIIENGYLLIHPFAGWAAKEWGLNKYIELAKKLNREYEVILATQPKQITEDIYEEIKSNGIDIIETADINELMEVIEKCSVIISNDSGPIYIANILGKPTFTIYGPTNPKFSLPYGKNHQYFQRIINCSPEPGNQYCFTDAGRNGCPSFECMHSISINDVEEKLLAFITSLKIKHKEANT